MRGNPGKLNPLGTGLLSPEEEKEIRSQGGKACAKRRRERRNAVEALRQWLDEELKNPELEETAQSVGTSGSFAPVGFDAILAGAILNTIRKGTAEDVKRLFELAGVGEDERDEEKHAAFLKALTEDDDERSA